MSSSRNKGISLAAGDYIVFFDADDYPEPELIEAYMTALQAWSDEGLAFVSSGMYFDNLYNKHIANKKSTLEAGLGFVEGEKYILTRNRAAMLSWLKLFNFVTNKCYDLEIIKSNQISSIISIKRMRKNQN